HHHWIGVMAQEEGYYIDVKISTTSYTSIHGYQEDSVAWFYAKADNTYSSPPGITAELVKEGTAYTLEERFGISLQFNAENRIGQWQDADDNMLVFSYLDAKLQSVQDAFGRTLTFHYSGDLIDSVSDSAGRSVSYFLP
ncbi:MAG: hypothetical protein AB1847_21240, partial [bacterium]